MTTFTSETKVRPPGTSLLVETGAVSVPGYDLFSILDCFPIVWKPRNQRLTDDPDEIQNHEWQGVSGKAFGEFHYQAWGTFRAQFMRGKGKIEKNIPPATLRIHELIQEARVENMADFLGNRAETKMGQIIGLVCQQPKGESGVLRQVLELLLYLFST